MFLELPEEDEYFKYATRLNEDPLFVAITVAYGKLPPERRKHLLDFLRDIFDNMDK